MNPTTTLASLLLTLCGCTLTIEAAASEPALLSAYLGAIDIGNPNPLAGVSGCRQVAGDDAMPVIFDVQVDASSLDPDDFSLTTETGRTTVPSCATLRPAVDSDELFTVLLTGDLGTDTDRPVSVEVSGEVSGLGGEILDGLSLDEVTVTEEGTSLVFAFLDSAGATCAAQGSTVEIAATFQGGVTGRRNGALGRRQLRGFSIVEDDGTSVSPLAFDDANDGDNHVVACVPSGVEPVTLEVDAGTLFDPGNNPNPDTSVTIGSR